VLDRAKGGQLIAAGLCGASLGAAGLGVLSGGETGDGPVLCPFRLATGLPCPFCGLTRSMLAAGGGDWETSLQLSPLGPVVLVLAAPILVWIAVATARRRRIRLPAPGLAAVSVVVLAAWGVQLSGGVA
jgi:hypothetical protein